METLAERLRSVMSDKGVTQQKLADAIGITQQSVNKIVTGETRQPKNILEIAKFLDVSPEWLKSGTGEEPKENNKGLNLYQSEPDDDHTHRIDLYDYHLAAGHGLINADYPDTISSIWFTQEGMGKIVGRTHTDGICIFKVPTDSMEPTISAKDLVFIDTNIRSYIGEGIYAFRLNGEDYIKRLQRTPSGIMYALSDNQKYRDIEITEELFDTAEIIGKFIRVVPINPRDL
ncbi:XRE family transcriptional regulator [Caviibacterium pharyngocola]|uniref:LexA family transcriptional repressor n=1 Tax=Caviibacterium pharyngocola TaxID=28159 RepID=A0A2M8RTF6_9PAST|nr:XRE family transcriptional regulator [Caviibacterium pharyngocola]PJG82144.1 LexA family transcriptional repressor [Caviibacterium pharyngocola]